MMVTEQILFKIWVKSLYQYKDFVLSAINADVPQHIEYLNIGDYIAAMAISSLHQSIQSIQGI